MQGIIKAANPAANPPRKMSHNDVSAVAWPPIGCAINCSDTKKNKRRKNNDLLFISSLLVKKDNNRYPLIDLNL
jgi:hypothetical protein